MPRNFLNPFFPLLEILKLHHVYICLSDSEKGKTDEMSLENKIIVSRLEIPQKSKMY